MGLPRDENRFKKSIKFEIEPWGMIGQEIEELAKKNKRGLMCE